jgi:hypothetical protein
METDKGGFTFTSYESFLDQAVEGQEYSIDIEAGMEVPKELFDYLNLRPKDLELWFKRFDDKLTFENMIKVAYFAWAKDFNLQEISETNLDHCFIVEGDEEDLTREIMSDDGPFTVFEENGISEDWLNIDLIVSDTMQQYNMAIVDFGIRIF